MMKTHEEVLHLGFVLAKFLRNGFERLVAKVEGCERFLDKIVSLYTVICDNLFRLGQRGVVSLTDGMSVDTTMVVEEQDLRFTSCT